jgi:tRNA threonylcarbamoyladenosine modification (KEOPS) complex  Pcc1 subunit
MTDSTPAWTASVTVRPRNAKLADWLEQALQPEAAREVPRARAEVHRAPDGALELRISARDSGAMRAALNTYLGWIHLSLATAKAADRSGEAGSNPADFRSA